MINLLGIGFIFIACVFLVMSILACMYPFTRCYEPVAKVYNSVYGTIFWGLWIRFLMEESLVAFIAVWCNVFQANECVGDECLIEDSFLPVSGISSVNSLSSGNSTDALTAGSNVTDSAIDDISSNVVGLPFYLVNNATLAFLAILLLAMPIYIAIFYPINFNRLSEPEFGKKYGEIYEGMHEDRKSSLFHSFFFLTRRYIFAVTICYKPFMYESWLQIDVCIVLALLKAAYLFHFKPYKESLVGNLEVFNELTTCILLYLVLCFTDFIPSVHMQVLVGYYFIFFLSGNMLTHIFFLLRSTFLDCK